MRNPLTLTWRDRDGGRPSPAATMDAAKQFTLTTEEELSMETAAVLAALRSLAAGIAGLRTSSVLSQHLAFVKDQLERADEEIAQLREENRELRDQIEQYERERKTYAPTREFTERHGALWKRIDARRYERVAYCPHCRYAVAATQNGRLVCARCNFIAPFKASDIERIVAALERG